MTNNNGHLIVNNNSTSEGNNNQEKEVAIGILSIMNPSTGSDINDSCGCVKCKNSIVQNEQNQIITKNCFMLTSRHKSRAFHCFIF